MLGLVLSAMCFNDHDLHCRIALKIIFLCVGMCEMVIIKDEPEIHLKQQRRLGGVQIEEG